jgi:hypothetical protein
MRLVRVCLIIIALMVPGRLAHAEIEAICATVAGKFANPMVTNVDLWLTRFRGSYAACLSQHEAADEASVPTKDFKETHAVKPGRDKTAAKPFDKKAAVKSAEVKPALEPGKKNPPEISRIEKKRLRPKHKSTKRVIPITPIKIRVLPVVNFPVPGSRLIRVPKTKLPDAGAESWRVNCSSRFGGFNKASETFLSSAGKRVSCTMRPKNAQG